MGYDIQHREHSSILQKTDLVYQIAKTARSYRRLIWYTRSRARGQHPKQKQLAPTNEDGFGIQDREHSSLLQRRAISDPAGRQVYRDALLLPL